VAEQRWRWLAVVALLALVAWDRRLDEIPGGESAGSWLSVPVESLVAFLVAFAFGVILNLYRIPLSPVAAVAAVGGLLAMPNSEAGSFWMTFAISYAVVVLSHFWPARLEVPGLWVNGSYGVYVWSFPIQQLLVMAGIANQYVMLVCAAPIAYVMGTLSWKFVEEPTMQLRHYIAPLPKRTEPTPERRVRAEPEEERRPEQTAVRSSLSLRADERAASPGNTHLRLSGTLDPGPPRGHDEPEPRGDERTHPSMPPISGRLEGP
jgi:hypothetical protein